MGLGVRALVSRAKTGLQPGLDPGWRRSTGREAVPDSASPCHCQEQRWRLRQQRLPTHDKVGKRRQEKMSPRQMAIFTWFQCCPWGEAGSAPRAGMRCGNGLAHSCLSQAPFIPFSFLLRYQLKVSDCTELGIQELIDRSFAGSVSCLVTPLKSNYHRGMHNGLINN